MTEKISAANPSLDPETWVDQYGDYLYRFALSRVQDRTVAEDLVQETFLGALHGRKNFKGRSAVQTWLTAILKHKIVDYLRGKNREQAIDDIDAVTQTVDGFYHSSGTWKIPPGKWDPDPSKIYNQREFLDTLFKCLSELPGRLSKVFMLREMEGLSTKEICNTLQVSATNSWVMLYRARAYLRRCLETLWFNKTKEENR
ncbi:MAG: sigma-70 family RNA polymerase sigma factor [Thermodesulfobacteriota bacterium]|nr:sigma-70 family RNA polymerase sigma factor [Thermodesulfobacteriota bacterium]